MLIDLLNNGLTKTDFQCSGIPFSFVIAEEAKRIDGFCFVWITDGGGWKDAKRNLEETFNAMDNLYNIADMEHHLFPALFR